MQRFVEKGTPDVELCDKIAASQHGLCNDMRRTGRVTRVVIVGELEGWWEVCTPLLELVMHLRRQAGAGVAVFFRKSIQALLHSCQDDAMGRLCEEVEVEEGILF